MANTLWTYPVELRHEEGEWHAYCAAMPEAIAAGGTEAQALDEMREAMAAAVRGRIKDEMELAPPPVAGTEAETHSVTLPAPLAAKASIYVAWRASGISKVALAETLGVDEKAARRLLDPDHATRLDLFDAAARALGQQLVIGTMQAA